MVLSVYINVIYCNLSEYIYSRGGARTCARCLVVRQSRPVANKVRIVNEMLVRSRRAWATKGPRCVGSMCACRTSTTW